VKKEKEKKREGKSHETRDLPSLQQPPEPSPAKRTCTKSNDQKKCFVGSAVEVLRTSRPAQNPNEPGSLTKGAESIECRIESDVAGFEREMEMEGSFEAEHVPKVLRQEV
jgi:hypothetical protein